VSSIADVRPTIPRSAFPWYLTSASLWVCGLSLQGFLITWMLVGILDTPADRVGYGRALIEIPGLFLLFAAGLLADRIDGRRLLLITHVAAAAPCLVIALAARTGLLSFWFVVAFGITVSSIMAVADPARQALLSRVTRSHIQRTVTIMTIVTSLVGLGGVWLGGQLDRIGLTTVLLVQAVLFAIGALPMWRLPTMPAATSPLRPDLLGGVKAVWRRPLIRSVILLNFFSSLFNAGAYIIAVPFIVKDVYGGDAGLFASVMIVFTAGSIGSNVILLRFMPLARPGRLFLLMQPSRVVILTLLWLQPPLWLFYAVILAWGLNMGVSTTLVRTTVQELASPELRGQILAVLLVSFLVAAPASSMVLGSMIAHFDPLSALLPGIVMSLAIFAIGFAVSGLWRYEAVTGSGAAAS
jgi:predicted MFS family arabinose efflux permease